jgi:hypothetical protein
MSKAIDSFHIRYYAVATAVSVTTLYEYVGVTHKHTVENHVHYLHSSCSTSTSHAKF